MLLRIRTALVVSALILTATVIVPAQTAPSDIYKKASPATVLIKTDKAGGSGFIVTASGVIATSLHILEGANKVAVKTQSGEIFDNVELLAKDDRKDIALLKITGFDLPVVDLGNSNEISPGDRIVVIGNPLATEKLQTSITDGIISGIRDFGWGYKVIQLSAPISPGNSGGPVLSVNGKAIGIAAFKLTAGENLNFAVPINYVRGVLESIDSNKPLAIWKNTSDSENVFSEERSTPPVRWKLLANGAISILRFDGEYIYAEAVQSEENRRLGIYRIAEVKKQGDKYVGINRRGEVWWQTNRYTGEKVVTLRCSLEEPVELTLVTPTRIEGRIFTIRSDARFNYKKCKSSKPSIWQNFVLVPE